MEGARWGEIPAQPNQACHDVLVEAIAAAGNDPIIIPGLTFSPANSFFDPVNSATFVNGDLGSNDDESMSDIDIKPSTSSATNASNQFLLGQTSPFYETIKLMLSNKNEQHNQPDSSSNNNNDEAAEISKSLRDSVILILTHTGFETASSMAVDTLVDVLEYYLQSFCQLLRNYTDSIDLQSPNDFIDTFNKVLHHMNVPNLETLRKYHQDLISYHNSVKAMHHSSSNSNSKTQDLK